MKFILYWRDGRKETIEGIASIPIEEVNRWLKAWEEGAKLMDLNVTAEINRLLPKGAETHAFEDAMRKRGYGGGALRALDFYRTGEQGDIHIWDLTQRMWVVKQT